MINIVDNFLEDNLFNEVLNYLNSNEFKEVVVGGKSFWVQFSDQQFDNIVLEKISNLEGVERKNIFSFFRTATEDKDTDWRIHSDAIIDGERPKRALVLYFSPSTLKELHGTALWKHKEFGDSLQEDVSFDKFDSVLENDSNDISKWELSSVIGYKVNRAVTYPCNYFHSKYPNKSWEGGRMVYVMFYK